MEVLCYIILSIYSMIARKWDNAMPFIPAAGCAKITLNYDQTGVPAANIFHASFAGAFDETLASDIANTFRDSWNALMMPNLASGLILETVEVRDLSSEDGLVFLFSDDLPHAGGVSQEFASNVAATITWQTGAAGRSQRGRTFLPGIPVGAYQKDVFIDAAVTNFQTGADGILDAMTTGGFPLEVVSFYHLGAPRAEAQQRIIISGRANKPVHTMKRRLV